MITRHHSTANATSWAEFSECGAYRYSLTRIWEADQPKLMYVMLNPSKADEKSNDPTVERCERRARALGYGAFRVTNIFAFRATDPMDLKRAKAPVGPQNDAALREGTAWADAIIAAWGTHGSHRDQGLAVARILADTNTPLFHLGLTKAGHPRHPLYISYTQQPRPWAVDTLIP